MTARSSRKKVNGIKRLAGSALDAAFWEQNIQYLPFSASLDAWAAETAALRAPASARWLKYWTEGCKSPPGIRSPACSRLQLRRREAGWRAAGGERSICRITNSIRPARAGEPAE